MSTSHPQLASAGVLVRLGQLALLCLLPSICAGSTSPFLRGEARALTSSTDSLDLGGRVVGILTQPGSDTGPIGSRSFIAATFVSWLESAGLRVVPIHHDDSPEALRTVLDSVNGVVFPSGFLDDKLRVGYPFFDAAKKIYDYAIERHAAGDPFPLWGTCQGLQLMAMLAANDYRVVSMGRYKTWAVALPVKILDNDADMYRMMSVELKEVLQTQNIAGNNHGNGVAPEMWDGYPELNNTFRLTGVTTDPLTGLNFSASFESQPGRAPMYAVQFHPEKVAAIWTPKLQSMLAGKSELSVRIANEFGYTFARAVAKSHHRFTNATTFSASLIRNAPIVCQGPVSDNDCSFVF